MTERSENFTEVGKAEKPVIQNDNMSKKSSSDTVVKKTGRRGRRPSKVDVKVKLERSRQSARECRARKKLRYQYLEELVNNREKAVYAVRSELEQFRKICESIDNGEVPEGIEEFLATCAVPDKPKSKISFKSSAAGAGSDAEETPYDILVDVLGAPREGSSSGKTDDPKSGNPEPGEEIGKAAGNSSDSFEAPTSSRSPLTLSDTSTASSQRTGAGSSFMTVHHEAGQRPVDPVKGVPDQGFGSSHGSSVRQPIGDILIRSPGITHKPLDYKGNVSTPSDFRTVDPSGILSVFPTSQLASASDSRSYQPVESETPTFQPTTVEPLVIQGAELAASIFGDLSFYDNESGYTKAMYLTQTGPMTAQAAFGQPSTSSSATSSQSWIGNVIHSQTDVIQGQTNVTGNMIQGQADKTENVIQGQANVTGNVMQVQRDMTGNLNQCQTDVIGNMIQGQAGNVIQGQTDVIGNVIQGQTDVTGTLIQGQTDGKASVPGSSLSFTDNVNSFRTVNQWNTPSPNRTILKAKRKSERN